MRQAIFARPRREGTSTWSFRTLIWWLALPLVALIAIAATFLGTYWDSASLPLLATVQVSLCIAGLVIVRLRETRLDPFHPIVLIILAYPLMYTLTIFALRSGSDRLTATVAPWLPSQLAAQVDAAALATVALVILCTGFLLSTFIAKPERRAPGAQLGTSRPRGFLSFNARAMLVVAAGLALVLALLVSAGGLGKLLGNLYNRTQFFEGINYLAEGPLLLAAVTTARLIRKPVWPPSRLTLLLGALTLGLTALTGSKSPLVTELLVWTIILHWRHRRIGWIALIAATLLGFTGLSMYDLYFRDAVPRGVPLGQVINEQGGIPGALELLAADTFFGQQALTLAVVEFPSPHSFTHLYSLEALAEAPIPRAWLPSKLVAGSGIFTSTFAPDFYARGSTIPATALGEMYVSFGAFGVIGGSLLLGFALGWVYRRRYRGDGALALAAVTVATTLQYMRGEVYGDGVLFLLLVLPTVWILRGGSSRSTARDLRRRTASRQDARAPLSAEGAG